MLSATDAVTNVVRPTRFRPGLGIASVLFIAVGARIYGIDFGLPYVAHPDEPVNYNVVIAMLNRGDLNPHFFNYPSLPLYAYLILANLISIMGQIGGFYDSAQDIHTIEMLAMGVGRIPDPGVFLSMRGLTALVGSATVWLVYLCARNLDSDNERSHRVGLVAAFLAAVSPTLVSNSRDITPDAWGVFFILLALWACLKVANAGGGRHYVAVGAAVGLAAASKYAGGLVGIVLPVAHIVHQRGAGMPWRAGFFVSPRVIGAGVLSLAVFLAAVPYAILDVDAFLRGMLGEMAHYGRGHPGMEGDTLRYYAGLLAFVEGPATLIAAAAIVYGLARRSASMVILVVFPLVYLALILPLPVRNARTLMPILPFLFLLAADLVVRVADMAARAKPVLASRGALAGLCVLLALLPVMQTLRAANAELAERPSDVARQWIDDNLPSGSRVLIEGYSPYVDPRRFTVFGVRTMGGEQASAFIEGGVDYLVFSSAMYGRYVNQPEQFPLEAGQYARLFETLVPVRDFKGDGVPIRIFRTSEASPPS